MTSNQSLGGAVLHFDWSPDGSHLAVATSDASSPGNELIEVDLVAGNARTLVGRQAGLQIAWPKYSPDGDLLYLVVDYADQDGIYSLDLQTGQMTFLVPGLLAVPDPAGESLAIWTEPAPGMNQGRQSIRILPLASDVEPSSIPVGSTARQIVSGIAWAPDSTSLAFSHAPLNIGSPREVSVLQLYTFGLKTPATWPDNGADFDSPAWSPDGTYLALIQNAIDASAGTLVIWNLSTGCREELNGVNGARLPAWSPDGSKIAFRYYSAVYMISLADARVAGILPQVCPGGSS